MNSPPLKVLQVVHALGMGGAETWLMEVLRLWHSQGVAAPQMDFLATGGERGVFDDEALSLGARIHYLPYGKRYLKTFTSGYRQLLNKGAYDAIHDHQDYSSGWHFMLARRNLPPVCITHVHNPSYQIRNVYGVTLSRRITASIGKWMVRRYASHITGTSRQIITEHGFDEPQFQSLSRQALHCRFEPNRFAGDPAVARQSICAEFGWSDEVKILLFAGRTDKSPDLGHPQNHKNSGFAVNLGIEAAKRDPSIRMVMCGAPSEATPILQARIDESGHGGRIVMAGIRKDIERFMLGSDLLLFPSRGEGLGMVAVEAQAAGLPVLASTAVPRECLVVDGMVRFLEVSDGFGPWLRSINETFSSAHFDRRSCNATVSASPFAIKNSARLLEELYSSHSLLP